MPPSGDPNGQDSLPPWNGDGSLPPGNYWPCRTAFEGALVNVSSSSTRGTIYDGWNEHRRNLLSLGCSGTCQYLLNGSFTTAKVDPGDLDLVLFFPHDPSLPTDNDALPHILVLLQGPNTKSTHHCDAYPVPVFPVSHPDYVKVTLKAIDYWMKWFSKDRAGREKGRVWCHLSGLRP